MNALLVYPEFPLSYTGGEFAVPFVGAKTNMPPQGLLVIGAMFPQHWDVKLVDMNIEPLTDEHLEWADYVFPSAMIAHRKSLRTLIRRCNEAGTPVTLGGPYATNYYNDITGVDHFVLDEVEQIFPDFIKQLEKGIAPYITHPPKLAQPNPKLKEYYTKPNMTDVPLPRYDLIKPYDYAVHSLQFSRGCPFNCDFCDITVLNGHITRTKSASQTIRELQLLYDIGWRGSTFWVDDNFYGNRKKAKEVLPYVVQWQKDRGEPLSFFTQASIDIAKDSEILDLMVGAGFKMMFVGIESRKQKALHIMKKYQNINKRDPDYLYHAVEKIQQAGLKVYAGFMIGQDGEDENVFDAIIDFADNAGIAATYVSLLSVLRGTDLYQRLKQEGRLIPEQDIAVENNFDFALNFKPEMDREALITGFKRVIRALYNPTAERYYERCLKQLKRVKAEPHYISTQVKTSKALFVPKILFRVATKILVSKKGLSTLRFLREVKRLDPKLLPEAFRLIIIGHHYEKVTEHYCR